MASLSPPPRNVADCVQRQRLDGGIRMRPSASVEPDDLLSELISSSPHIGVRFGVGREPRQRLTRWSLEDVAEVSQLEARYVLDQAQRFVPVGTIGRRMSNSDRPSSFQSRASRPSCR